MSRALPGGVLFWDLQIDENSQNHELTCSKQLGRVFFQNKKKAPAGRSWITKSLENTIESVISGNQTIPGDIPTHIPPFGAIYGAISMKKQPGLDWRCPGGWIWAVMRGFKGGYLLWNVEYQDLLQLAKFQCRIPLQLFKIIAFVRLCSSSGHHCQISQKT